jgi:prepilin-type N-terminal cleavage/methylation domain-containing protein
MTTPNRQPGFTLLELILAMAMTAMLAMSLYASLRTAFRARDSATAMVEPVRDAQMAMDLVGRDLENALPPKGILAGAFEGTDGGATVGDTLEFFAIRSGVDDNDPTKNDGICKIDLDVEPLPDGTQALVRRTTRNLLSQQQIIPDPEVLCRNVVVFDIQYFAEDVWNTEWDSTQQNDTLPAVVQVTLQVHKPGSDAANDYHMIRTFTLPCHVDADATSTPVGGG